MRSFAREATKVDGGDGQAPTGSPSCWRPTRCSRSRRTPTAAAARSGEIALEDVSFAYGGERPALQRRLAARRGRASGVALDGPVGRRQVDARRARRALLRPDRGPRADRRPRRARLLARRGCATRSRSCCRTRCCSPAACATTSPTAPTRRREEVVAAARAAAAHEFIRGLPDGYDTELGPQGVGALRRPAPADRHRPHAAARPAGARARRADHGARPDSEDAGARGPRAR